VNIYVGNLALETTEDELRRAFIAFGEVLSVHLMNDRYIGSGQTKGYAYVEMAMKSAGFAAIASLNGKRVSNRVVEVIEALPLSDRGKNAEHQAKSRYHLHRDRRRRNF